MKQEKALHVLIEGEAYKVGTCAHCVLSESGRPERAWDADGDTALDFERDTYYRTLAQFGLQVGRTQAYVCP